MGRRVGRAIRAASFMMWSRSAKETFTGWPRGGIMHLKVAVIDREVVILGSYNWTDPAERQNKEILEIKRSREYAERLIGEIEGIR